MWPVLSGLISGGASLLGGMFSSQTSAANTQQQIAAQEQMQSQSEQFNAQQADINRGYQTQMSNTAYQRASADMQKAGLNPMMMFGSGGAASSPAGSTASVGTPSVPMPQTTHPLGGLGAAVSSAVNTGIAAKTFDKMTEEIANLRTQEARTSAETTTERERARLVGSEADRAGFGVTTAQAAAERAKRYIDMPQWLKNSVEYGEYGSKGISAVGDAISSFVPTAKGVRGLLQYPDNPTRKYGPEARQEMKDTFQEMWDARVR